MRNRTLPRLGAAVPLAALLLAPATLRAQEPAPALTLEAAERAALASSPDLRRADAGRSLGRAARADGLDALLPRAAFHTGLNGTSVLQRTATDPLTGGIVALPDSLIQERRGYGTEAVASVAWTLFAGGRNVTRTAAARSRTRAADHAYEAARVRVAAEAALAYLDVLEAEALVEVRRAQEAHARELERTAAARHETGQVPEIDLLQARLATSEAEIAVLEAEGEARVRRIALASRLGMEGEVPALAPAEALPPVDLAALRARLLAASPTLAALHAERDAAARERRAGRLSLLPVVDVGVDRVWSEFGQTREAFTLEPRNSRTYYNLTLSWAPLSRPGGALADRRREAAALQMAEAELAAGRRRVEEEVAVGLERLARAEALAERSRLSLALAERQRQQADERYRLGLAPVTERLNAAALWAGAAHQAVLARYAALRAAAELERSTGVAVRRPFP